MAYIALFDILGFRQLMRSTPLAELVAIIRGTWSVVVSASAAFAHPDRRQDDLKPRGSALLARHSEVSTRRVPFIRFADTILMHSASETDDELGHLILAGNKLIALGVLHGLPVRGAVTKGELYVADDGGTYLGEGLARAHDVQQAQDWCGAVIDSERISVPDVFDEHRNVCELWDGLVSIRAIMKYEAPFKDRSSGGSVWCLGWPGDLVKMPDEEFLKLLGSCIAATDERARRKVQNTFAFFRAFRAWSDEPLDFVVASGIRMKLKTDC